MTLAPTKLRPLELLLGVCLLAAFLTFVVNSFLADPVISDFGMYWNAGRHYLFGEPLYSLQRDLSHPYKYPPWTTVLSVPFALLPIGVAAVAWRLCLVACMAYVLIKSARLAGRSIAALTFLLFWGFWNLNILAGQANVIWLALAWLGFEILERRPTFGWLLLLATLSGKIFQLWSLIAVPRRHWKWKSLGTVALILALSCIPALLAYDFPWLPGLLRDYREAAAGGGPVLGGSGYGLPVLGTDLLGFPRDHSLARTLFFLPCALLAWGAYAFVARELEDRSARFTAALALGAAIHPMAFAYTFVFCYPFAAITLARVFERRNWPARVTALMGLAALVACNSKTLGSFGAFLESHQIKAIGVFIFAGSFAVLQRVPEASTHISRHHRAR